ncbi:hypothetical protein K493DRAFT_307006 [Basidiobolus meristosporus CBS 931.73]|uniref:Uncharacterized protein n=1 Tax=Basidiobolus meristosporus CBS 931.73 TaxID=1314790 RepID=A0A1Y1XM43_9FUNG|nr:hypothetical protein K493DRAFT_307006 [Basidiobolus meristosporus CBS 931.73]|eukprot:ORX86791.1 hypothetical protein K493DRAFT_307006 [Basidiobolus meristosporus CBS 931.73]
MDILNKLLGELDYTVPATSHFVKAKFLRSYRILFTALLWIELVVGGWLTVEGYLQLSLFTHQFFLKLMYYTIATYHSVRYFRTSPPRDSQSLQFPMVLFVLNWILYITMVLYVVIFPVFVMVLVYTPLPSGYLDSHLVFRFWGFHQMDLLALCFVPIEMLLCRWRWNQLLSGGVLFISWFIVLMIAPVTWSSLDPKEGKEIFWVLGIQTPFVFLINSLLAYGFHKLRERWGRDPELELGPEDIEADSEQRPLINNEA